MCNDLGALDQLRYAIMQGPSPSLWQLPHAAATTSDSDDHTNDVYDRDSHQYLDASSDEYQVRAGGARGACVRRVGSAGGLLNWRRPGSSRRALLKRSPVG
jgi:hypothetical protein